MGSSEFFFFKTTEAGNEVDESAKTEPTQFSYGL